MRILARTSYQIVVDYRDMLPKKNFHSYIKFCNYIDLIFNLFFNNSSKSYRIMVVKQLVIMPLNMVRLSRCLHITAILLNGLNPKTYLVSLFLSINRQTCTNLRQAFPHGDSQTRAVLGSWQRCLSRGRWHKYQSCSDPQLVV